MARIPRFPKMAALQKFRALRLGYPEEEAEAIGIAQATKYAIFKNLHLYGRRTERAAASWAKKGRPLDLETYRVFQLAALDGRPFVGGRTYTAEDYKRALYLRYGEETAKKIEEWAQQIIEATPEDWLKDERKFFKNVWVVHRDDAIA